MGRNWVMEKKIEIIAPNLLLLSSLVFYLEQRSYESIWGLAFGVFLWLAAMIIPRVLPNSTPSEFESRLVEVEKNIMENTQFVGKELGTIKSAMQIKQMGR